MATADALARVRNRRVPTWAIAASAVPLWVGYIVYAKLASRFSLDLRVYRDGAIAFVDGRNPFHLYFTPNHLPFTYPPAALLVFVPLSWGSVHLIEALWWLVNAAALIAILSIAISFCFALSRTKTLAVAVLLTPIMALVFEPVRTNTNYGQVNVLLFLLVLVDIVCVRGRRRGVLVGLAGAIKLTPLIYLIYFGASRDWRALWRTLLTFLGLGAVVWIAFPRESEVYWLHQVFDPSRTGHIGSVRNQSIDGVLHRWPITPGASEMVWFLLALITLCVGAALTHRLIERGRVLDAVVALGLTGELISPISWTHHWVWIVLIPVLLVRGFVGQPAVVATMVVLCLVSAIGSSTALRVAWVERGLSDSLVLVGGLVLVTWLVSEVRLRRSRVQRLPGRQLEGRGFDPESVPQP